MGPVGLVGRVGPVGRVGLVGQAGQVGCIVTISFALLSACDSPGRPPVESIPVVAAPRLPPLRQDYALGSFFWPLDLTIAEEILSRTNQFAWGLMDPKRQVQAFNVIFDQPDALLRFRRIARDAGPAGKLYALCAFIALRSPEQNGLVSVLALSTDRIELVYSDVSREVELREAATTVLSKRLAQRLRDERAETDTFFRERDSRTQGQAR